MLPPLRAGGGVECNRQQAGKQGRWLVALGLSSLAFFEDSVLSTHWMEYTIFNLFQTCLTIYYIICVSILTVC